MNSKIILDLGSSLNPVTGVLIGERGGDSRPREDGHVMTEAEMDDEATARGTRGAPISWGGRKGPALEPAEGVRPCPHLHSGLSVPRAMREHSSVLVKPPDLLYLLQQCQETNTTATCWK